MSRIESVNAMRAEEFDTSSLGRPDPGQPTELECDAPVTESRALITLAPMIESFEGKIAYRHTPFLAQLVATKQQHPQTRERRRAEPDVALAAYRATAALTHS